MDLIYLLLFLFATHVAHVVGAQPFKTLAIPITQTGPISSPFAITINQNDKLVIDIESALSWHRCPREFPRVSCHAPHCALAQSSTSPSCQLHIPLSPPKPPCTCFTLPSNPFAKLCASSQLTYTNVTLSSTDSHNPLTLVNYNKIFISCAPRSLFTSIPSDYSGIASLSRGSLSLVSQFATAIVSRKFAICLCDRGVAFFGEVPYYLSPPPGRNAIQFLSYTPLVNHPSDSSGYYISVKGISVSRQSTDFLKSALSFDAQGSGGVKLSTVTPYTKLRSNIYKALLRQFATFTNKFHLAPKTEPFDYCLNTTNLGLTRTGLPGPQIDLELSNGANWTIFGDNSMIQVSSDVACLAFVDGGKRAKQGIVIGSYQMQNNFLLFDLVKSRLGFSSSLSFFQTGCNNFNFTYGV